MNNSFLNLELLRQLQHKPLPFTPGEPHFWDDIHISSQMLAVHLDPTTDAASRRPETIQRTIAWIMETLALQPGDPLMDLGCGPGLYAAQFAERGLNVTGVDLSQWSIDYALQYSREHQLSITYRCQNYLTLEDENQYAAALLIFGDFCPLAPAQRQKLLQNVHRALKSGGCCVLDVSTREHRQRYGLQNRWYAAEKGFWKPEPHLVLEQGFDYPEESIFLDQYTVIEANGKISVYRNWFQDYTADTITAELEANHFRVKGVWGDLTGTPYTDDTEWIGVIAEKV